MGTLDEIAAARERRYGVRWAAVVLVLLALAAPGMAGIALESYEKVGDLGSRVFCWVLVDQTTRSRFLVVVYGTDMSVTLIPPRPSAQAAPAAAVPRAEVVSDAEFRDPFPTLWQWLVQRGNNPGALTVEQLAERRAEYRAEKAKWER